MNKPRVKLTGTDGNVFALLGLCARTLKAAGQRNEATKLSERVMSCSSYDEALQLMMEYCDVH